MLVDGVLTLPILSHDPHFPIIQYADDTILIVHVVDSQLIALKEMLDVFYASTGLKVNFQKSTMVPLNIDNEEAIRLAAVFGCSLGTLPFTYLGLPWELLRQGLLIFSLWLIGWKEGLLLALPC